MYILTLLLLLNSFLFCNTIENGWKGIEPLKADKAAVNKLLGTPEVDDNGYYGYTTDEAFIQVNYSTAPCENNQYKRGKYNVPKDTILDYVVNVKKTIKLSELAFNREKYKTDTSGDVGNVVAYYNEEDGIMIEVGISREGTEYVKTIYFRPKQKTAETLKCKISD